MGMEVQILFCAQFLYGGYGVTVNTGACGALNTGSIPVSHPDFGFNDCFFKTMEHHHHTSLNRLAMSATLHCFTGCAIGEVLGMVFGTMFGLHNLATIVLAIVLAFVFGYSFTLWPLLKSGMHFKTAFGLAFASDTMSITIMEIADNVVIFFIPGALNAHLGDKLFWLSLAFSLLVAIGAAFPVNRWLIKKGRGHALIHAHHDHH